VDEMEQLILMAQKNDTEALESLMRKYYKEIYGYVLKSLLDKDYAMDLTQEIFIRVFKEIKKYDSKRSSFRTWLYLIASTELRHYFKKNKGILEELNDQVPSDYDLLKEVEKKQDIRRLNQAISKLKKADQQIITLRYHSELGLQEIADIMGKSLSTIHYQINKIEGRLRTDLKKVIL
jgi:RNA polymerase sigma-70 factor (ECF subfamily)